MSRYLFITEDGEFYKSHEVKQEHIESVNIGILDIIDTVDMSHLDADEEWVHIEEWPFG